MNLSQLLTDTFSIWWPGAILLCCLMMYSIFCRPWWGAKIWIGLIGYSITCLAITMATRNFFEATYLIPLSLFLLALTAIVLSNHFEHGRLLLQVNGFVLLVLAIISGFSHMLPNKKETPPVYQLADLRGVPGTALTKYGEYLLFGSGSEDDIPRFACVSCHTFRNDTRFELRSSLRGVTKRIHARMDEPEPSRQGKQIRPRRREAYPGAGVPTTPLEFLVESILCHTCYRSNGQPKVYEDPFNTGKYAAIIDLVAVVTLIFVKGDDHPPSPQAIIDAYRKFVPPAFWKQLLAAPDQPLRLEKLQILEHFGTAYPEDYMPSYERGLRVSTNFIQWKVEKLLFGEMSKDRKPGSLGKAKCAICHEFENGAPSKTAPNLYDVVQQVDERLTQPQFQAKVRQARLARNVNEAPSLSFLPTTLEYLVESTVCHRCFVMIDNHDAVSNAPPSSNNATENPYEEIEPLSILETSLIIQWMYANSLDPHDDSLPSLDDIIRTYETFLPSTELAKLVRADAERYTRIEIAVPPIK